MTTNLAIPESHRDLLQSDVVILATVGRDGFPQVTATWFILDDDGVLKLSLHPARQKVKNLRRDPHCTLFFIDRANPYRTLEIRAVAELTPDPDYTFADKISKKYGADLKAMDPPGQSRFMVGLKPAKVNAYGTTG
jgi:PPOX class probable F420-dependent enzyme